MIYTPVKLDRLDNDHAIFTGTAEETRTVSGLFGEMEFDARYPIVVLQRALWEDRGSPIVLILQLDEPDGPH